MSVDYIPKEEIFMDLCDRILINAFHTWEQNFIFNELYNGKVNKNWYLTCLVVVNSTELPLLWGISIFLIFTFNTL